MSQDPLWPFDAIWRSSRAKVGLPRPARYGLHHGLMLGATWTLALIAQSLLEGTPLDAPMPITVPILALAGLLSISVGIDPWQPRVATVLRWLSIGAFAWIVAEPLGERPGLTFALGLLALGILLLPVLATALGAGSTRRRPAGTGARLLRGALLPGFVTWMLGALGGLVHDSETRVAFLVGVLIPVVLGVASLWRRGTVRSRAWAVLVGIGALAMPAVPHPEVWVVLLLLAVWPASRHAEAFGRVPRSRAGSVGVIETLLGEPSRLLITTFFIAGILGGAVLALPIAANGEPVGPLDAMFTAFSATCVTGLITVDTPGAYNGFGQLVILLLIQLGGLGILTFSTTAFVLLGRRISLAHEQAMASVLSDPSMHLRLALGRVLRIAFFFELAGAAVLTLLFLRAGDDLGQAAWRGVFTSISAYCNAGFALQSASLIPYQHNALVLHTVALLVVAGGLGPAVVGALPSVLLRRRTTVHVRVVLVTTVALLVIPAAFFLAVEWGHSLAHLSPADRVHNAWFQSVTLRTAGFNSIDLEALRPVSWTVMMALMFVGGSPASTAGGIKTTTLAVLLAGTWSAIRGHKRVRMFGAELPIGTLRSALAVALLGAASVVAGTIALQLTQNASLTDLAFESFSAAGTVGLSLGTTGRLDEVGKIIVMAILFAGRVGPLSLAVFLMGRRPKGEWTRPEQDLAIG